MEVMPFDVKPERRLYHLQPLAESLRWDADLWNIEPGQRDLDADFEIGRTDDAWGEVGAFEDRQRGAPICYQAGGVKRADQFFRLRFFCAQWWFGGRNAGRFCLRG